MSLLFGAHLPNRDVTDEMATRCSLSTINRHDLYFVFMTVTAEYPVPHNYVVTRGSKTFIALSDKLG
jgi:hypothetical protein